MNFQEIYYVVLMPSLYVIWQTNNKFAAVALTENMLNTMVILRDRAYLSELTNFIEETYTLSFSGQLEKIKAEDLLLTQLNLNKKTARLRGEFLIELEYISKRSMANTSNYFFSEIYADLMSELQNCDVMALKYSSAVQNYANVHDISNVAAYNELKIIVDSHRAVRLRNYAIVRKYIVLLKDVFEKTQIDQLKIDLAEDLFFRGKI